MQAQQFSELLTHRHSVRGFTEQRIKPELLTEIFSTAQLSISNCNTQPWQAFVVSGEKQQQLKQRLVDAVCNGTPPSQDFAYFDRFKGEQRSRQIECAMALYNCMGIERSDKKARQAALLRNYEFFDAPHIAILCMPKNHQIINTLDMGIYLQTLMLTMESHGIGSCAQGALSFYSDPIKHCLDIPEELGVLVGLSFGYEDTKHPANKTKTTRAPLEQSVKFFE